jgi:hypothetical protein
MTATSSRSAIDKYRDVGSCSSIGDIPPASTNQT